MFFFTRTWRLKKLMYALFIFELGPTIALLALFGIASPDLYRTQLWEEGHKLGLNSSPQQLLYAYANYEPISAPLPWSQFLTDFNLVISVLSMFLLLTKVTMHIMAIFWPIISVLLHAGLVAVWTYSVYGQAAPDNSSEKYPTNGPCWYITKDCSIASSSTLVGYCKQAKAAFGVSIIMLALFAFHMFFAVWNCIPNAEQKQDHQERVEEKRVEKEKMENLEAAITPDHQWELRNFPQTPGTAGGIKSPYTPRTQAFNNLGGGPRSPVMNFSRDLPLRDRSEDGIREV